MEVFMRTWQLQEAKSKFSQVINLAVSEAPQLITKNGKPVAYIISSDAYNSEHSGSIKILLLDRPHKEIEIVTERSSELPREVHL